MPHKRNDVQTRTKHYVEFCTKRFRWLTASRLPALLPVRRFRPNLLIETPGDQPFVELPPLTAVRALHKLYASLAPKSA